MPLHCVHEYFLILDKSIYHLLKEPGSHTDSCQGQYKESEGWNQESRTHGLMGKSKSESPECTPEWLFQLAPVLFLTAFSARGMCVATITRFNKFNIAGTGFKVWVVVSLSVTEILPLVRFSWISVQGHSYKTCLNVIYLMSVSMQESVGNLKKNLYTWLELYVHVFSLTNFMYNGVTQD